MLVLAAALVLFTACGDDDDGDEVSAEDAFCEAGDQLRSDLGSLADIDVITEGTDGVRERFDAIGADVEDLRSSGREVAADELDALDEAVDELGEALDALGDDGIASGAGRVVDAISGIGTAGRDVLTALDEACP